MQLLASLFLLFVGSVLANETDPITLKMSMSLYSVNKRIDIVKDFSIKTYIPEKAYNHLPTLKAETKTHLSEIKSPEYFGGLIEQESCISLTHRKCWDPTSTLSTKREHGVGLGQITKAYHKDGSIRFDSLSDMARIHKAELKELSWNTVAERPDLQIRTILLMSKDNFNKLYEVEPQLERLKMSDAAYNSGLGSVYKRRLQCSLTAGCNKNVWDNNVGSMKVLSSKPIYGIRSPQSINDEHVENIFKFRMHKYKPYLQ